MAAEAATLKSDFIVKNSAHKLYIILPSVLSSYSYT